MIALSNIQSGISLVLMKPGTPAPKNALCLGEQKTDLDGDGQKKLWSVICDGSEYGHGKIPGKLILYIINDTLSVLLCFT